MATKTALYQVGDVIVTKRDVIALDSRGRKLCTAAPGWKWRITRVDWESKGIHYEVESVECKGMYRARLAEGRIKCKV